MVADCAPLLEWLRGKLQSTITPALCAQFGLDAEQVWLEDAFVIKYEAAEGGQPGLGFHRDDSELSFNILLSSPAGFTGGGTSFHLDETGDQATTLAPQRGEMLSHFGRLNHAGNPVSDGTRYVLAGFVRAQPLAAEWRRLRFEYEPSRAEDLDGDTAED